MLKETVDGRDSIRRDFRIPTEIHLERRRQR